MNLECAQLLLIDLFWLVLSILIQPVLCVLQHQCQMVTVLSDVRRSEAK